MVDALHVLNSHVPLRPGKKTSGAAEIAAIHSDQMFSDDHWQLLIRKQSARTWAKLCVFATLWQIWHGNTFETHANFEITYFQCFFVLVFASKCAIDACFAISLVQKDDLVFLGAKEA